MTDATTVVTWYHKNWPIQARHYEIDNTTDMIRLKIPGHNEEHEANWDRVRTMIHRLIIACDSTSFDVHVFNVPNGTIDGVGQIYKSTGNNKWVRSLEELPFVNRSDPQEPYIYLKIVGGSNVIYVDLMVT